MMKRTKVALVAGTAVLAMAGVGGGIAFAADGSGTAAAPSTSAATPNTGSSNGTGTRTPKKDRHHGLVGRFEHGQLTVHGKSGDQVVDVQRGQVTAVSATSVTVRSKDGFTATYTIASTSKVMAKKQTSTIAGVHTGDRVGVAALKSGNTDTVRVLRDAGPATK
jgi:hypothetical protein